MGHDGQRCLIMTHSRFDTHSIAAYTGTIVIEPPCQLANVEIYHGGGAVGLQQQSHAWAGQPRLIEVGCPFCFLPSTAYIFAANCPP